MDLGNQLDKDDVLSDSNNDRDSKPRRFQIQIDRELKELFTVHYRIIRIFPAVISKNFRRSTNVSWVSICRPSVTATHWSHVKSCTLGLKKYLRNIQRMDLFCGPKIQNVLRNNLTLTVCDKICLWPNRKLRRALPAPKRFISRDQRKISFFDMKIKYLLNTKIKILLVQWRGW